MGIFGLIGDLIGDLYDSIDDFRETYERDFTLTEEDYVNPGCLMKAKIVYGSQWMEGKYPFKYRMACDQEKLDEIKRSTPIENYRHKDY